MNLWNKHGVPHKGWTFVRMTDSIESSGEYATCMMCDQERVRYVHWMEHDEYPDTLGVGCICAGKMELNYESAQLREKTFINRINRRKKWFKIYSL